MGWGELRLWLADAATLGTLITMVLAFRTALKRQQPPSGKDDQDASNMLLSSADISSKDVNDTSIRTTVETQENSHSEVISKIYRAAHFISQNRKSMRAPPIDSALVKRVLGKKATLQGETLSVLIPNELRNFRTEVLVSLGMSSLPAVLIGRAIWSASILAAITVTALILGVGFFYPFFSGRVRMNVKSGLCYSSRVTDPVYWLGMETLYVRRQMIDGHFRLFINGIPISNSNLELMNPTEKLELTQLYEAISLNLVNNPMVAPGVMIMYDDELDESKPIYITQPKD